LSPVHQLRSPKFWRLVVFMILAHTAVNFYMGNITDDPVHPNASPPNALMHTPRLSVFAGTVDFRLTSMEVTDASVRGRYCHMYTLINSTCAVLIPIVGHVMDTWGFTVTWVITVTLAVIWTSLLLLESISLLLLSFFFAALFRTFLYTFIFAYLADAMGFRYFGLLSGILFLVAGALGLGQYWLALWAQDTCLPAEIGPVVPSSCHGGRWRTVNRWMLVSFLLLFLICLRDYIDDHHKDIQASSFTVPSGGSDTRKANYSSISNGESGYVENGTQEPLESQADALSF